MFENVPAENVSTLELNDYQMGGCTALCDAMITAIETSQEKQDGRKNQGFLVVLISDGMENASGTTKAQLASRIGELESSDKWTFTYMLDGHDWESAKEFAIQTGVGIGNVSTYDSSPSGTRKATKGLVGSTVNYLSARQRGITSSETFHNDGSGEESKLS